jgi:hypothetical protein
LVGLALPAAERRNYRSNGLSSACSYYFETVNNERIIRFNLDATSAILAGMERVVHRARSFAAADAWDVAQQKKLTPSERAGQAAELKKRNFPPEALDLRAWYRQFPREASSRRIRST